MKLGKLEKVEIRSIWEKEDKNFTPWLSKEENLKMLGDEIGIDIELISTEAKTGSFSTDILAINPNTDNKIIIENQFEQTDHDHLGKLITYASGHDANTIIWITEKVREEHRQAVDWLNEHTDEGINIFLCKIELWKIDDSATAPKFQIISSPNNWTKIMRSSVDANLSPTKELRMAYWEKVREEIENNYSNKFSARSANKLSYYTLSIGTKLAYINLDISPQKEIIKTRLVVKNSELFEYLFKNKNEVESKIGAELIWQNESNQKRSNIAITKDCNISNEYNWNESIKWQLEKASVFYDVFLDRIKNFKQ